MAPRAAPFAVAATVAATAASLALPGLPLGVRFAVLLAALGIHGWLLVRHGALSRSVRVGAIALLACAVVVPPRGSHDIWLYATSGRLLAHYHVSPYTHRPIEHPEDEIVERMAPGWRSARTPYGPVFTAVSAAGMRWAGDSGLRARLVFQGGNALAVLAAIALLERRRSGRGWLLLGLNPAVVAVVNGGHNDLVAGVLLLAGALALSRSGTLGGVGLGLAVASKATAAIPAAAILLAESRTTRRGAIHAAGAAAATVLAAYSALGQFDAVRSALAAGRAISRASLWASATAASQPLALAVSVIAALALAWIARATMRSEPAAVSGGVAGLAYLLTAAYVMPWYPGGVLPLAATTSRASLVLIAQAQAALMALAYVVPPGRHIHGLFAAWTNAVPVMEAALLVALLAVIWRAHRSPSPTTIPAVDSRSLS